MSNIFAFGYDGDDTFIDLGDTDTTVYSASDEIALEMYKTLKTNQWTLASRGVRFLDSEGYGESYSWIYNDHNEEEEFS